MYAARGWCAQANGWHALLVGGRGSENIDEKISEVLQETSRAQENLDRAEGHLDDLHRTLDRIESMTSVGPVRTCVATWHAAEWEG